MRYSRISVVAEFFRDEMFIATCNHARQTFFSRLIQCQHELVKVFTMNIIDVRLCCWHFAFPNVKKFHQQNYPSSIILKIK